MFATLLSISGLLERVISYKSRPYSVCLRTAHGGLADHPRRFLPLLNIKRLSVYYLYYTARSSDETKTKSEIHLVDRIPMILESVRVIYIIYTSCHLYNKVLKNNTVINFLRDLYKSSDISCGRIEDLI